MGLSVEFRVSEVVFCVVRLLVRVGMMFYVDVEIGESRVSHEGILSDLRKGSIGG